MRHILMFSLVAMLAFAGVANAAVINVPADQPTIQAGLNAAADGDTVKVAPGEYLEANIDFPKKAIALEGSGIGQTIIKLPANLSYKHHGIRMYSSGSSVSDLTIEGDGEFPVGVTNVQTHIWPDQGGGANNLSVTNVHVDNIRDHPIWLGAKSENFDGIKVLNCIVSNTKATNSKAIELRRASGEVSNCVVYNHSGDQGIRISSAGTHLHSPSKVYGNIVHLGTLVSNEPVIYAYNIGHNATSQHVGVDFVGNIALFSEYKNNTYGVVSSQCTLNCRNNTIVGANTGIQINSTVTANIGYGNDIVGPGSSVTGSIGIDAQGPTTVEGAYVGKFATGVKNPTTTNPVTVAETALADNNVATAGDVTLTDIWTGPGSENPPIRQILALDITGDPLYIQPNKPVVVTLSQSSINPVDELVYGHEIELVGYQSFLSYDPTRLIVDAIIHSADPYEAGVLNSIDAVNGIIGVGAGTFQLPVATNDELDLATISFTTGTVEGPTTVEFAADTALERTQFTLPGGYMRAPQTVATPEIIIDGTPPTITVSDITVPTDAGKCYATEVDLGASITDQYGLADQSNDAPEQFPLGETVVTWTAVDNAGNEATVTQTVTVVDEEDPVFTYVPADITVNALAGQSYATVDPGTATATDNCGTPTVEGVGLIPSGNYPIGTTTITWTATDDAGNKVTATQKITVNNVYSASIKVELIGVTATVTRPIEVTMGGTGTGLTPFKQTVSADFVNGKATIDITVPAGVVYSQVSAKDPQHTLRSRTSLTVVDGVYEAELGLTGGDATGDNIVDILDFGVFASQNGRLPSGPRDANFDCVGIVDSADFTFIANNFLKAGDAEAGSIVAPSRSGVPQGRMSITVAELATIIGKREARNADLDGNGIVDQFDIVLYMVQSRAINGR